MNPIRRWKDRLAQMLRCLAVVLPMGTAAAQAPAFLTNGLVAYYPFNGNANDESGNGKHGQLISVQIGTNRFGQSVSSAEFSGNTGYVKLPELSANLGQPRSSFTASLWVKPIVKGANFFISATTDNSYQFCRIGCTDDYRLVIYHRANGRNHEAAGLAQMNPNVWNFVVFQTDGISGLGFVYVNGVRDASMTFGYDSSVSYYAANRTWAIGTTLNTTCGGCNPFYQGGVDDVRIYNRALSESEVQALYEYEKVPQPASPRTASATAQVVNGFVVGATVVDGGGGYTNGPAVTISGGGGNGATAVATVTEGRVTGITIKTPGSGYTAMPSIVIAPPPFPPRRAQGASQVVNGFVVVATVSDAGFGYDSPPAVTLIGGGGSGASATATVANGVVTGIVITQPGSGYTSAPTLRIASPPFSPKLGITVSRVKVTLDVVLGRKYQLESSSDLTAWTPTGPAFIAEDEQLEKEFEVATTGRYFRIQQVP